MTGYKQEVTVFSNVSTIPLAVSGPAGAACHPLPGADLEEMVTDFRNNKRRRRKVLGGDRGTLCWEIFFCESFIKI